MGIEQENLAGKTILEIGSGRGDTTRKLVELLTGQIKAQLIVTDISGQFFPTLRKEFEDKHIKIQFVKTGADELTSITNNSVDYLVCNYALCAVNAKPGALPLALRRFWEVLADEGQIFLEEEFPINYAMNERQKIWAEKWRILKSAMILLGQSPYIEIAPETLASLCRMAGFENMVWTSHYENYQTVSVLDFFQKRLDQLLNEMPNESLITGFSEMALALRKQMNNAGGMEIPYYQLYGRKHIN